MTELQHIAPEDLTLFAMQFLSDEESAPLTLHLEHCAECRRELAHVQGDLAMYACTVEMHSPPAQVRQRMMKQVAREKKVIAIDKPAAAAAYSLASSGFVEAEEQQPQEKPKRHVARTVLDWTGWAVAAGLAFSTVTLYRERDSLRGIISAQTSRIAQVGAEAEGSRELMSAMNDPKAMRVTLTKKNAPPTPIGRATYNPDKGTLIFLASNLEPLQMYKVYELWLIPAADGRDPIPAGTFKPDDHGNASVILPELPKGVAAKAFGVTVEEDGGSQTPTLPIIMAGT
jgi:Anti-sigma-K factor rskA